MRNKGVVVVLSIIITLLCVFYLSFTFISQNINQDAVLYATDKNGSINLVKKQVYLDSLWNKPVYNLFGAEYTYKEVKENELSLGLDLQGGMHVVLEVSPAEIIRGLSGDNQDSAFTAALQKARERMKTTDDNFADLFYTSLKEINPDRNLATYFASAANRGRVSLSDTDETVLTFLKEEIESAFDRSFTILKTRIDQFGTSQPNIQRLQRSGQIQIEIPGADNPKRVRKLLQGVARLEFWEVVEYGDPQLSSALISINQMLLKTQNAKLPEAKSDSASSGVSATAKGDTTKSALEQQLSKAATDTTGNSLDSLAKLNMSPLFALSNPGIPFLYNVKDTSEINRLLKREDVRAYIPRTIGWFWDVKPEPDITPGVDDLRLNFVNLGRNAKPLLSGEVINDARLDYDQFARPAVSMTMNVAGSKVWAKVTSAASAKSPQGRIAIVLDNYVYTAPTVQGEIPNGNSQITGSFELEEAKDLANVLKAGSLPAPTRIVEEAIVGPTLGKVAQEQGFISMASVMVLVVLFMIIYYAKSGLVANIALLFNIFFTVGILAQLNAALTLPGIAGIVLTMGMALDANVLINERIKEELEKGRLLVDAIKTGFDKAFWTIFDSNLTTLLTAGVLFLLGQGPLKGFATTLGLGILTSFFTSIYIARVIMVWMSRKGQESKISFDLGIAKLVKQRKQYEFVKNSKRVYLISTAFIVIGLSLIFVKPLNFGVDFKGGRSYIVSFSSPVVATDLKVGLTKHFEGASTEVKNYGTNSTVKITSSYLIDTDTDEADEKVKQSLTSGLEQLTGKKYSEDESQVDDQHFFIASSSKVGPTVADDIKNSAWEASVFSLLGIFVYLLARFRRWQFSAGATIALIYDTLIVFASFAIANVFGISFEIDQVFVAAILTIIGYSVNDKVIVFDRIRENINLGTSHDLKKIVNNSVNETLSRTIITGGTTLMGILVMLIFGGEVLRGFSFAMLVGVVIGTFSSMFIAAPIVIDFDKATRDAAKKGEKPVAVKA